MTPQRKHRMLTRIASLATYSCILLMPGLTGYAASLPSTDTYASPLELLLSSDNARLYVLCSGSDEVRVYNARTFLPVKTVKVGHSPRGFSLSSVGDRLYVVNSWDDTLSVIDTRSLAVVATWAVGAEPSSVVADPAGTRLFVANRISNDVVVLNATTGQQQKRLVAGRGASYLTESADGKRVYVSHVYPELDAPRTLPHSELTVIDSARAVVAERIPLPAIAGVFHAAVSLDGRLAVVAELHPKNLVPLAHVEHGWAFANSLTLFGQDAGAPAEIPLDELERYASRPFATAISPDKRWIYVSASGSESVVVVDVQHALRFIRSHPAPYTQDLSASSNYVSRRIRVGHDPRGLALSRDGLHLFVANRLDDTISIIETAAGRVTRTIKLQSPAQLTSLRRGEQTFYTSRYSFQGQIWMC